MDIIYVSVAALSYTLMVKIQRHNVNNVAIEVNTMLLQIVKKCK